MITDEQKELLKTFVRQYDSVVNMKTKDSMGTRMLEDWKRDPQSWKRIFKFQHTALMLKTTDEDLDFINELWGALLNHLAEKEKTNDNQ